MISRSRSAPTAAAMSIERTTSANSTVTCLYSAWASPSSTGEPQLWQNRAFSRGSMPHVRHAAMAVTRPPPIPAPGSHRIGDRTLHEALLALQLVMTIRSFETLICRLFRDRVQFCSGLVDLVEGVSRHGGAAH